MQRNNITVSVRSVDSSAASPSILTFREIPQFVYSSLAHSCIFMHYYSILNNQKAHKAMNIAS